METASKETMCTTHILLPSEISIGWKLHILICSKEKVNRCIEVVVVVVVVQDKQPFVKYLMEKLSW